MKDGKTQAQIAKLMERHKSTISRELARNTGLKGYRPKQACLLAEERSLGSRNAVQVNPNILGAVQRKRHLLALTRRDLDRALCDALARLEVTAGGSRPDKWSVPCVARSEHTVRFKYSQQVQPTVAMYRIPLLTQVFA